MGILGKRIIALIIDGAIFGCLSTLLKNIHPDVFRWFSNIGFIGECVLFSPFICRDVFFRTSIGKKIMGLEIYDCEWMPPKRIALIKRSVLSTTIGELILFKAMWLDKNIMSFFAWERDWLKYRVVDKNTAQFLRHKAISATITPPEKQTAYMTELYDEYLENFYHK